MIKVLFVCHGNICRSPMAEYIFREMVREADLSDQIQCASAATSNEEIGHGVYPPARAELKRRGIHCEGHRARRVTEQDFFEYDFLICMDNMNLRNVRRMTPAGADESKISRLLDWTDHPREIDDPWYTGRFEEVGRQIDEGCRALLTYIEETLL